MIDAVSYAASLMQLSLTPENIRDLINLAGLVIDVAGVMVILTGAAVSTLLYLANVVNGSSSLLVYRKNVGRSLLLGLEFLVGGDVIRTVSVAHPELMDVIVLAMIVVIRTAMSWAMEVELDGRWPWLAWRATPNSETPGAPPAS
jgi:uncharacterized membrane protein